ncbi:SsgA family sporulation/cell division regulator [Streptomyces sp. NPDC048521]|uniref:SsgA family sporulation/cell division regulator n=1 Tax=Streptomyces sp. NPDC048521 TaxID=3365566 RepID=UPI0037170B92
MTCRVHVVLVPRRRWAGTPVPVPSPPLHRGSSPDTAVGVSACRCAGPAATGTRSGQTGVRAGQATFGGGSVLRLDVRGVLDGVPRRPVDAGFRFDAASPMVVRVTLTPWCGQGVTWHIGRELLYRGCLGRVAGQTRRPAHAGARRGRRPGCSWKSGRDPSPVRPTAPTGAHGRGPVPDDERRVRTGNRHVRRSRIAAAGDGRRSSEASVCTPTSRQQGSRRPVGTVRRVR